MWSSFAGQKQKDSTTQQGKQPMPKETSAKPKRQRVSLDECLWPLFIEACGGVCCFCKQPPSEVGALQRGHVQRHEDKGPANLENLMPLCEKCNGKNNQHFNMPEGRLDDWRSNFLKLVAHSLKQKPMVIEGSVTHPKNEEGSTPLPSQNSIETNRVISWEKREIRN
jgi:5-methylcytosine-specific restriction endonuclease McrA